MGERGSRILCAKAGAHRWPVRARSPRPRPANMASVLVMIPDASLRLFVPDAFAKHCAWAWLCSYQNRVMPTLSRRKAARRNDMEDIEDDATPQHPIRDEVQESDGEQAASKKSIDKRRALQEVSNDLGSDSDDPIDVENFPNQPLKRNQLNTLQSLAEDWQKLAEVTSRTFGMYGSAAGALADLDDDNTKGVRNVVF